MTNIKKILVVGGGIAGLCVAIGLRDSDAQVEIVELNPKWDVYGVGIIQLANQLRALGALGVADRAVAEGYPMSGLNMHAPNGHLIAHIPQPQIAGPNFPAQNGITRPKLHVILQDAAKAAGAAIRLGVTVNSITDTGTHAHVTFTDGSQGDYDLVVGADGLRSTVRALVFDPALQPVYEGQMCWRYNLPKPESIKDISMWLGDPKVGLVPMSPEIMYMFITDGSAGNVIPKFREADLAAEMRARLAGYGDIFSAYAAQITDSSKVVVRPFETILVPGPWHRGRVVLVGDSAHAMTAHIAQGAAMAIEDAVVLTEEIKRGGAIDTVLANYNTRRFPRVSRMIELCRQICVWEREHTPNADVMGVTVQSMQLAAQPI